MWCGWQGPPKVAKHNLWRIGQRALESLLVPSPPPTSLSPSFPPFFPLPLLLSLPPPLLPSFPPPSLSGYFRKPLGTSLNSPEKDSLWKEWGSASTRELQMNRLGMCASPCFLLSSRAPCHVACHQPNGGGTHRRPFCNCRALCLRGAIHAFSLCAKWDGAAWLWGGIWGP
jgi:hypothetical protein